MLCMQGRFHFYEGYEMDQVVFPIQVMKMLGIERLILTNAAGCVNTAWKPGTLMLINDHIKLAPQSPMRGPNEAELGLRFFDMSRAYDPELLKVAKREAEKLGIPVTEGVYMFFEEEDQAQDMVPIGEICLYENDSMAGVCTQVGVL